MMLKRVGLIHPSFNRVGGAERVGLTILKILVSTGYTVHLYTLDRVDWGFVKKQWEVAIKPHAETWCAERINFERRYLYPVYLLLYIRLLIIAKRENPATFNNYGEIVTAISDITYVHSVPFSSVNKNMYQLPLWRVGKIAHKLFTFIISRIFQQGLIIANSRYNASFCEAKGELAVIYPPIVVSDIPRGKKKKQVLTISRIEPGKNLEVFFRVSQLVDEAVFILAGSVNKKAPVLKHGTRVKVVANPTQDTLRKLRDESMVYLATMPEEAYGMSVLEAMERGCIPFVPRSGGPWVDVLDESDGKYGYGYSSVKEAAGSIRSLFRDGDRREAISSQTRQRALFFGSERFEAEILRVFEQVFCEASIGRG